MSEPVDDVGSEFKYLLLEMDAPVPHPGSTARRPKQIFR